MEDQISMLFTQRELARRWGKSEAVISLASSVGAGPRYVRMDGEIVYTQEEVQRYERACLFFDPAEVAMQDRH
jgi:3,4-dihydroxy-2-butanone 4-phosphate synthase